MEVLQTTETATNQLWECPTMKPRKIDFRESSSHVQVLIIEKIHLLLEPELKNCSAGKIAEQLSSLPLMYD
jgi:hypothetical protein